MDNLDVRMTPLSVISIGNFALLFAVVIPVVVTALLVPAGVFFYRCLHDNFQEPAKFK